MNTILKDAMIEAGIITPPTMTALEIAAVNARTEVLKRATFAPNVMQYVDELTKIVPSAGRQAFSTVTFMLGQMVVSDIVWGARKAHRDRALQDLENSLDQHADEYSLSEAETEKALNMHEIGAVVLPNPEATKYRGAYRSMIAILEAGRKPNENLPTPASLYLGMNSPQKQHEESEIAAEAFSQERLAKSSLSAEVRARQEIQKEYFAPIIKSKMESEYKHLMAMLALDIREPLSDELFETLPRWKQYAYLSAMRLPIYDALAREMSKPVSDRKDVELIDLGEDLLSHLKALRKDAEVCAAFATDRLKAKHDIE